MDSIIIKFDKYLHSTPKANLFQIGFNEYWIPSKMCRRLILNKKLGGTVSIPQFFADKLGLQGEKDTFIKHHVPNIINNEVNYDNELFR